MRYLLLPIALLLASSAAVAQTPSPVQNLQNTLRGVGEPKPFRLKLSITEIKAWKTLTGGIGKDTVFLAMAMSPAGSNQASYGSVAEDLYSLSQEDTSHPSLTITSAPVHDDATYAFVVLNGGATNRGSDGARTAKLTAENLVKYVADGSDFDWNKWKNKWFDLGNHGWVDADGCDALVAAHAGTVYITEFVPQLPYGAVKLDREVVQNNTDPAHDLNLSCNTASRYSVKYVLTTTP